MATLTNTIPEKTIERLSEYRRTLLACHQAGHHAYLLPRAGRHPRHHGGAGAPRPDADRLFERHEEGLRREGAHRFHQQHPRQRHGDQHRRAWAWATSARPSPSISTARGLKLKITTAFDIDPAKVGQTIDGIPCHHMESFEEVVEDKDIDDRHRLVSPTQRGSTNLVAADHQCRHTGAC